MPQPSKKEQILNVAIVKFSDCGYTGVSMRDIARECGLNVGSLYYHFSDKQQLYLAAAQQAFSGRSSKLLKILQNQRPARDRLNELIDVLCQLLDEDQTFSRMIQREVLDGDEQRLKQLAEQVFGQISSSLQQLCRELNPQLDPTLLASSLIGLTLHLFQYVPLNRHLPGFRVEHQQMATIRQFLQQLFCQGLTSPSSSRGNA